ncbi:MAG: AraC family transcriptional regulator [Herbinix sp.]|jgi:YesN/AraC family two-component response regulator|nr:AraC family transcriptional regulator [Herbinix sp.]
MKQKVNETIGIVKTPSYVDRSGINVAQSSVNHNDYYHNKIHYHYFYELELFISGSGTYEINNVTYDIKKGTLFLVTPADFHQYILDDVTQLQYFNVQFQADTLSEKIVSFLYSFSEPIYILLNEDEYTFFTDRLYNMVHLYQQKFHLYETLLKNEIESLCIYIIHMLSNKLHREIQDDVIKNAIIYIKNNYRHSISLENISAHVGLSPCYFSSYFSNQMKISFSNYVRTFRINIAANLIKSTNMTLNQISYEVGFKTFSYFSTQFQSYFHIPPKEYKKYFRNNETHYCGSTSYINQNILHTKLKV